VIPGSTAASGHTTVSPARNPAFQIEASLIRPAGSTNSASS
jgi:hypothetical protein